MSSSSSSFSGSSKESTPNDCEDCHGTCLWTADLAGPDVTGQAIVWTGHSIVGSSEDCSGSYADYQCGCSYPSRNPEFVGDTESSSCSCCRGCAFTWNHIQRKWYDVGLGSLGCTYSLCPRPYCEAAPTGEPELIADKYYAAYYVGCQSTNP